ncbi:MULTISPECIES: hypothetical protein [Tenacibaculum]|uniref:hypothetical protein n=1 Tax=Tenacibaculum TaxID=104267 RepID=UPI000F5B0581|nr:MULTISPECIES: hypothetical protein [Tenacibaculum]NVK08678.1 hypothetical protein [Tenacibaculum sp.]
MKNTKTSGSELVKEIATYSFWLFSPFIITFILNLFFRSSSIIFTFIVAIIPLVIAMFIHRDFFISKRVSKVVLRLLIYFFTFLYVFIFTSLTFWGILFYFVGAYLHTFFYSKLIDEMD